LLDAKRGWHRHVHSDLHCDRDARRGGREPRKVRWQERRVEDD